MHIFAYSEEKKTHISLFSIPIIALLTNALNKFVIFAFIFIIVIFVYVYFESFLNVNKAGKLIIIKRCNLNYFSIYY